MEPVLSASEISARLVELALAESAPTETRIFESKGSTQVSFRTSGHLANGRYASTLVYVNGPMMQVSLNVVGMGGLSIHFSLFADEATDERVERYLDHYLGLHEMAVQKFQNENISK